MSSLGHPHSRRTCRRTPARRPGTALLRRSRLRRPFARRGPVQQGAQRSPRAAGQVVTGGRERRGVLGSQSLPAGLLRRADPEREHHGQADSLAPAVLAQPAGDRGKEASVPVHHRSRERSSEHLRRGATRSSADRTITSRAPTIRLSAGVAAAEGRAPDASAPGPPVIDRLRDAPEAVWPRARRSRRTTQPRRLGRRPDRSIGGLPLTVLGMIASRLESPSRGGALVPVRGGSPARARGRAAPGTGRCR